MTDSTFNKAIVGNGLPKFNAHDNTHLNVRNNYKFRHRKKLNPMTFVFSARCKDGVVLVADRKVSRGEAEATYTDKIRGIQGFRDVIFSAAGLEPLFDEFLRELPRRVNRSIYLVNRQNEELKIPEQNQYRYDVYNFKHDCVALLTEMKSAYMQIQDPNSLPLQVIFVVKEWITENNLLKQVSRLYYMDWQYCFPLPVEDRIAIGVGLIGEIFMKNWKPIMTMRQSAELGAFIIKYIEQERLTETVGVGQYQPQIYYVRDGEDPKPIEENELNDLIKIVDEKVKIARGQIGSSSGFFGS